MHPTTLHIAAFNDDADEVRRLLDAGADPNIDDEMGVAARAASRSGVVARLLLSRGARPIVDGDFLVSPIHHAAYEGLDEVVDVLLEAGVPVDDRDAEEYTPSRHAASQVHADVLRRLLDHGADPNAARLSDGWTVLMSAASGLGRNPAVVQLLLDRGADPKKVSDYGYTALHAATDCDESGPEHNVGGNRRAINSILLRAGVPLEAKNASGQTPLLRAIMWGYAEEAIDLRAIGADPRARVDRSDHLFMSDGGTLLHYASYTEDTLPLFRAAIAAGADLNARDEAGQRPIERFLSKCGDNPFPLRDAFLEILTPPGD